MGKMVNCKTCGQKIAKTAKVCPNCGAQQHQGVYAVCTLIAVFAVIACIGVLNSAWKEENGKLGEGVTGKKITATESPAANSEPNAARIGETGSAQNFDITVVSGRECTSLKNALGVEYTADVGKVYVILTISAVNTTNETRNIDFTGFNSSADGEKVFMQSVLGEIDGHMPLLGAVSAGVNFTGYAVWEVPSEWNALQFSYIDSLTGKEDGNFLVTAEDIQ